MAEAKHWDDLKALVQRTLQREYGESPEDAAEAAVKILAAISEADLRFVPRGATPNMVRAAAAAWDGRRQGRFYDAIAAAIEATPFQPDPANGVRS